MAKKAANAVELKASLELALPDAESAVVTAAKEYVESNKEQTLREAVMNLIQIEEAISAMNKIAKKAGKQPAFDAATQAATA